MHDSFWVQAEQAPTPVGAYPHAKRVGNLVFLSGVGPRQPGSNEIPGGVTLGEAGQILAYDFEAQCHAVFENVRRILAAMGMAWEDLVDVTVFLINMRQDFATFNRLYSDYFQSHQPCRTTVEVSRLPTPIAIELKCIAAVQAHL